MQSPHKDTTLRALWVFPVDAPPQRGGLVTFRGDKIIAVEPAGSRSAYQNLGNVAILPGFVNAHTHLDLSDARGKIPPTSDFTGWLRRVIAHRRQQTPEQVQAAIAAGIAESRRYGVTLLADIASGGMSWNALTAAPLRAVVLYEVLGLSAERSWQSWEAMMKWWSEHSPGATCIPGVSPHAPYSVHESLFAAVAERKLPCAVHLAESSDEIELLRHHRGPFKTFLEDMGVWHPEGLAASPEAVIEKSRGGASTLFVHGNYLDPEVAIPANATIVYCPRTHAAFGHPPHPFREFLKHGVRVVLGTDSLASNPDLDVLAEARFIAKSFPEVPGDVLLRMFTIDAATVLGFGDLAGSLTPGKSADLVVVPLPQRGEADPHRLLFDSSLAVKQVIYRGQWLTEPEA